jgi:hypothetical protein
MSIVADRLIAVRESAFALPLPPGFDPDTAEFALVPLDASVQAKATQASMISNAMSARRNARW